MNDFRVQLTLSKLSDEMGRAGFAIGSVSIDAKASLTADERDLLLEFQKRMYALQLELNLLVKR